MEPQLNIRDEHGNGKSCSCVAALSIISRHFMCDKKYHVVLCLLVPDPGDALAPKNIYLYLYL